jgi:anti-sigma factor RsiW
MLASSAATAGEWMKVMNCSESLQLLHPYADGELDVLHIVQMEEHLAACPECNAQLDRLQSLRESLAGPELYFRAPAASRARVRRALSAQVGARPLWRRSLVAAVLLLAVGSLAGLAGILFQSSNTPTDRLANWVVAAHVRSLQAEHLIDVASADTHTVKPWFRGKLDFSPLVPNFAQQGYELAGGRLDYLDDRPAAGLVYRRGKHVINLFTWPAADERDTAVHRQSRQGFNIRNWQQSGMNYWAVSDVSDDQLDEFVQLFSNAAVKHD